MKIRKLMFLAAAAGAVAAYVQKQQQVAPEAANDIWKPVDPLRPFGEREDSDSEE